MKPAFIRRYLHKCEILISHRSEDIDVVLLGTDNTRIRIPGAVCFTERLVSNLRCVKTQMNKTNR